MVAMLLIGFLLGALAAGLVLKRRSGAKLEPAQNAELAASQLRLRDYAIGQMLKGTVPDFEHMADYYRVFHLEFSAEAFMLLVVKLRGYPNAGEPDAQDNAYGTVREELTGDPRAQPGAVFCGKGRRAGVLLLPARRGHSAALGQSGDPSGAAVSAVPGLCCIADGKARD